MRGLEGQPGRGRVLLDADRLDSGKADPAFAVERRLEARRHEPFTDEHALRPVRPAVDAAGRRGVGEVECDRVEPEFLQRHAGRADVENREVAHAPRLRSRMANLSSSPRFACASSKVLK